MTAPGAGGKRRVLGGSGSGVGSFSGLRRGQRPDADEVDAQDEERVAGQGLHPPVEDFGIAPVQVFGPADAEGFQHAPVVTTDPLEGVEARPVADFAQALARPAEAGSERVSFRLGIGATNPLPGASDVCVGQRAPFRLGQAEVREFHLERADTVGRAEEPHQSPEGGVDGQGSPESGGRCGLRGGRGVAEILLALPRAIPQEKRRQKGEAGHGVQRERREAQEPEQRHLEELELLQPAHGVDPFLRRQEVRAFPHETADEAGEEQARQQAEVAVLQVAQQ